MTELEKLEYAKSYLDKLANGIDPLTDQALPDDTLLNQVRLSRCFFYVSDVLHRVIENGGEIQRTPVKKEKLAAFSLSEEQRETVELSNLPLPITKVVERINALVDETVMSKLKLTACTGWLLEEGYLQEDISGGKRRRVPTQKGAMIGLHAQEKESLSGVSYLQVFYDRAAQQFLLNHLEDILREPQE